MSRCDRAWQVEAARDQRLASGELAAFLQHRQQCVHCQQEQRALDALARRLDEVGAHVDDVALRRLRKRTLERAIEKVHRAPRRRARVAALALACAAAALTLMVWAAHGPRDTEVAMVHVEPQRDARWRRAREPNVERVELSAGTLLFRVARKAGDPRLIVQVPDGEIEDLGTVFSVTVLDGKTREVVVREGQVVFHRKDATKLHLAAGTSWQAPPEPAATPSRELAPAVPEVSPPPAEVKKAKPRRAVAARTLAPVPDASVGEDDAYLHILALLREGRRDEARLAAFSYLHTYPAGFRALEVSKVAAMTNTDTGRN